MWFFFGSHSIRMRRHSGLRAAAHSFPHFEPPRFFVYKKAPREGGGGCKQEEVKWRVVKFIATV